MRPFKFRHTWIDLDHVLAISDPYFINKMGYGGWFVEFAITFMFKDGQFFFTRELKRDVEMRHVHYPLSEAKASHVDLRVADTWLSDREVHRLDVHDESILAVSVVAVEMEGLLEAWRAGDEEEIRDRAG